MSQTPVLGLPYPVMGATADVPRDIQALASKLDGMPIIPPSFVSALPASPVDGQEVYYQNATMATAGVLWHLRYRAASASTYKWEFVGGSPWRSQVDGSVSVNNSVYTAQGGPSMTLPRDGEYVVAFGASIEGGWGIVAVKSGATAAGDGDSIQFGQSTGFYTNPARELATSGAAGNVIELYYRTGSATTFQRRWLSVRPVRVI